MGILPKARVQALDLRLVFLPKQLSLLAETLDLGAEGVGFDVDLPGVEAVLLGL